MVTFRTMAASSSFVILLITTVLIAVSHFGDKSESWTKRLIVIAGVAGMIFLLSVFW